MSPKALKPFIVGLTIIFIASYIFTLFQWNSAFPHIDKIFHTLGGFVVAWFFSSLWSDQLKGLTRFQRFLVLMGLAALVGFAWEVMEYSTSVPPLLHHPLLRHYLYGGDLTDTLGDLMADVFGGAVFGFLLK